MVISPFGSIFLQGWQENLPMSDYFWLREAQFERIKPYFPLSHGVPRVDDRRVVSGGPVVSAPPAADNFVGGI